MNNNTKNSQKETLTNEDMYRDYPLWKAMEYDQETLDLLKTFPKDYRDRLYDYNLYLNSKLRPENMVTAADVFALVPKLGTRALKTFIVCMEKMESVNPTSPKELITATTDRKKIVGVALGFFNEEESPTDDILVACILAEYMVEKGDLVTGRKD